MKAFVALLLRFRLMKNGDVARLVGGAGSPAGALDSAISKSPAWLLDVLGYDAQGTPYARRIFRRLNPERKRPGPVEVLVNDRLLSPDDVKIVVNGVACFDDSILADLLWHVLKSWPSCSEDWMKPVVATVLDKTIRESLVGEPMASPVSSVCGLGDCLGLGRPAVIAESDLVVIKSVTLAWRFEEILKNLGIETKRVTWNWSDDLLEAIHQEVVDLAIYNTVNARRFINDLGETEVRILTEWGHSMGGRNFYLLARKDSSWQSAGMGAFLERLKKGATIVVPEKSDMINNLLAVLNNSVDSLTGMGIEIVPVPVSQGLEVLDLNPDALLIHGQNVRFKARFRGLYHEILNYDLLPSGLQKTLLDNSSNSVIIGGSLARNVPLPKLLEAVESARKEFTTAWNSAQRYTALVNEIVTNERKYGILNEEEMSYVVKRVLYETYRFGKPGH